MPNVIQESRIKKEKEHEKYLIGNFKTNMYSTFTTKIQFSNRSWIGNKLIANNWVKTQEII